ncbi:MAG: beta-lactamase family protein [Chloracidobacterium sp.]|nr:beta-lactamase family protein [Chloracidobacterium sp.]
MSGRMDRRAFARIGLGSMTLAGFNRTVPAAVGKKRRLKLSPLSEKFLTRLPIMMELANVPGVSVAYVENGRESWSRYFGVRDAGTREPVTADTVWQVGSLSKPVFAMVVMKLVEAGKIDPDRPLANYLPGELIKDEPRAKSITARHALSQSTGLQNWRFQAGQTLSLSFAPGERWSYSGEGIYYLQRAVEQITGLGLEQLAREHMFGPLGMASSSYYWLAGYDKRIASSHNGQGAVAVDYIVMNASRIAKVADQQKKPVTEWRHEDQEKAQASVENRFPPFPTFFPVNAAGTLITTTSDYAKFLIALMGGGRARVLDDRSVAEMLKPQIRINDTVSWALGWGLQADNGQTCFWHWGEGVNYRTFVIGDRSTRSGLIVFTNGRNGRKIWERIVIEATGSDQPLLLWL